MINIEIGNEPTVHLTVEVPGLQGPPGQPGQQGPKGDTGESGSSDFGNTGEEAFNGRLATYQATDTTGTNEIYTVPENKAVVVTAVTLRCLRVQPGAGVIFFQFDNRPQIARLSPGILGPGIPAQHLFDKVLVGQEGSKLIMSALSLYGINSITVDVIGYFIEPVTDDESAALDSA